MSEAGESKFRPSKSIAAYIEQLRVSGLYGKTKTDVMHMLVRDQILLLIEKGQLQKLED